MSGDRPDSHDTVLQPTDLGSAPTLAGEGSLPRASFDSLPQVDATGRTDAGSERYLDKKLLGEGGMGEVRLVRDQVIGREVAKKVVRGQPHAEAVERFLREARVQAQLEHPAIVPVYDLGTEGPSPGRVFFTMKRVRGRSLEQILDALAAGDGATVAAFPRRRLLGAFVQLCLAMEYVHARGVLHRDLKPANVMLGDFGEVHVLDWGLARVRGTPDRERTGVAALELPDAAGQTVQGSLLGTPGYMAPEQARGRLEESDARADVYSLGAILFELLYLEPLHGQPSAIARLTHTVQGPSPSLDARKNAGLVPPELRGVVEQAIALDVGDRLPSARALAERVERFLDGERDAARRAELAEGHVRAARAHEKAGRPAEALGELGRAIALDPTHREALAALQSVLVTAPSEVPWEARVELKAMRSADGVAAARTTAIRLFTWLLAVPLVLAFGITDWTRGALVLGALGAAAALATVAWRSEKTSDRWSLAIGVASSFALATFSFLLGPFVVVPGLASTNAMFFAMTTDRQLRPAWLALGVLAIAVPFALELAGVDPHYVAGAGGLEIRSTLAELPLEGTLFFLLVTSLATILTPTILAGRMRDRLAAAEERLFLQAWHLKHLLPKEARA